MRLYFLLKTLKHILDVISYELFGYQDEGLVRVSQLYIVFANLAVSKRVILGYAEDKTSRDWNMAMNNNK
jgi:hypothetical protein